MNGLNMVIAFLIVLGGVMWRTVRPYMKKMKEAEEKGLEFTFNKRFIIGAVASFISCIVITFMVMGAGSPMMEDPIKYAFALFAWGAGQTEIINREIL